MDLSNSEWNRNWPRQTREIRAFHQKKASLWQMKCLRRFGMVWEGGVLPHREQLCLTWWKTDNGAGRLLKIRLWRTWRSQVMGWIVSFQRDVVRSSGSHNVTLFGNRVVVDIIRSVRLSLIRWPIDLTWQVSLKENGIWTHTHIYLETHKEKIATWRWRQTLEVCSHKPQNTWSY